MAPAFSLCPTQSTTGEEFNNNVVNNTDLIIMIYGVNNVETAHVVCAY